MIRKAIFISFFILFEYWALTPVFAKPLQQGGNVSVRVCYDNTSCTSPSATNTDGPYTLVGYLEQVLANEWHGSASLNALKAGAIAIRTFS